MMAGFFRTIAALVFAVTLCTGAAAQVPPTMKLCDGTVANCPLIGTNNPLPVTGSFSVSGFTPNGSYGTLTATAASSASTALPTGTVVGIQNTTSVDVSCVLDPSAATATTNKIIVRGGATVFATVGTNTKIACINQTGSASNVIALMGGSGLGTNFGGGGSGSGGLSVIDEAAWTAGSSSFTPNGGVYNDSAAALTSGQQGAVRLTANREMHVDCDTSNIMCSIMKSAVPWLATTAWSTNSYSNGTTNPGAADLHGAPFVDVGALGGTAIDTNSGNKSAGTQRNVLATDQLALATWGHGATGAAAPSGATQMGVTASGATGGQMRGAVMCDSHVFKHITTATDTLAVQGVASQTIYICGWRARAAGVATWFLENTASANANCSSSNTQITGVATEAANTGEVFAPGLWNGLKNTSGNGLCINSTGTGGVDVDIWYTQF